MPFLACSASRALHSCGGLRPTSLAPRRAQNTAERLHGVGSLSFAAPVVTDTTPVATAGGEVIVTGDNFGTDVDVITVEWEDAEGWHDAGRVELIVAHTVMRCALGAGSGRERRMRVYVVGLCGDGRFSYCAPVIVTAAPF